MSAEGSSTHFDPVHRLADAAVPDAATQAVVSLHLKTNQNKTKNEPA